MIDCSGKNVLVTGATSGIGEETALYFAKSGANVAINYPSPDHGPADTMEQIEKLCESIQACGGKELPVQANVSIEAEVDRMFDRIIGEWGGVDILINNAGIQIEGESHEISIDAFDKVIGVNLRGAYLCARAAIRHFLHEKKPGNIVNISSVHEEIPKPGYIGYSASKGGMRNLTRSLALEYADRKIRVNSVAPGAIVTPINRSWIEDSEKKAAIESRIPMQRVGDADEIAAAVGFLVSGDAAYITGQTLYVDGGLTLYPGFKENWTS